MLQDIGNRLYRCRCKVLYKFFGTRLGVVFDEKYIQDLNVKLGWDPNFASMNADTTQGGNDIMSFTGSGNTCSVAITDPFFTGIAWPSLLDVAGAAIGTRSYQTGQADGDPKRGILRRKCKEGETPAENDCWDYELIDLENWIPTNNANAQVSGRRSEYAQPAMIMISLWYEAYNGYTFGTDYLFRVSGSSVSHGSEFPTVTLSGQGNFGITFQDRLVNVSIDNELEVEKALAELAARNGFNMEFCVADYDTPDKLERRVIKSNLTIKQLLDDIIKHKKSGNYLSLPTKDMYNTLHVCTRADTWPGCSVFYLGKPLYEGYKVSAIVDSSMVGRNLQFGDDPAGTSRADGGSKYLPSFDQRDTAWEVMVPEDKSIHVIKSASSGGGLNIQFRESSNAKSLQGNWTGFMDERKAYFTTYNDQLTFLEKKSEHIVEKKTYEKLNPGYVGEFQGKVASVVLPGRVTEFNEMAEGGGKSITVKTDYVLYLRGLTTDRVSKLDIYSDLSLFDPDQDVEKGYVVEVGAVLGKTTESKKQNLTYYVIVQNIKMYFDPIVAYTMSVPITYDPDISSAPPSSLEATSASPQVQAANSSQVESKQGNLCFKTEHMTANQKNAWTSKIGKQNIILTFDDGPDSTWTPKILDVLKKHNARATFYLIGNRIPGRESIVKRIISEGHDIASHSQNHPNFEKKFPNSSQNRRAEIKAGLDSIAKATSRKPSSFRFPYGAGSNNPQFIKDVEHFGLSSIFWHLDPKDFKSNWSADQMIKTIESQGITGGQIILFHDGLDLRAGIDPKVTTSKEETVKAVDRFLTKYKNKFSFNTTIADVLSIECGNIGDGEADDTETATTPQPESTPLLKFKWPMSGCVTSQKGTRWGRQHGGIDISSGPGTGAGNPVYAAAPGTVQFAGWNSGGFGNLVIIKHGDTKYTTYYAHLHSNPLVKTGQSVNYDTQIGVEGSTGRSTGTHLHFEIKFDGERVSPDVTWTNPIGDLEKLGIKRCYKSFTQGSDKDIYQPSNGVRVNVDGVTISPGGQSNANTGQSAPGGGTGFNIDTEFKGVPRALRILPKFTILSFVGNYQAWLQANRQIGIDPGVWIPNYFKNWLIKTVQFNWVQGDLRVKINASSVFGIDNSNIVPTWESYAADLASNGNYSGYVDYIRAYGDLCWNDNGRPSCHTRCAVTESAMLSGLRDQQTLSSANVTSCENYTSNDSKGKAIIEAAKILGVNALDLAAIIEFESDGRKDICNNKGYCGLIQFGPNEQRIYGYSKNMSWEEQVKGPVVRFFKDRFKNKNMSTQGADLLTLYRTVIGGNPKANIDLKDSNGVSARVGYDRMIAPGGKRDIAKSKYFSEELPIPSVCPGATKTGSTTATASTETKKI